MKNKKEMTEEEKKEYRRIKSDIEGTIKFVGMMCISIWFGIMLSVCILGEQDLRLNEGNDFGKMIDGATITQIKRVDEPYVFTHKTHYEVAYIDKEGEEKTTNLYYTRKISVEESSDSLYHATVVNGMISLFVPDKFESK